MAAPMDMTPLHDAVRLMDENGNPVQMMVLVINHPEAITLADPADGNFTALFHAVLRGRQSLVEVLIALGADIRAVTADQCSVIHAAIASWDYKMVKLFLSMLGAEASTTVWQGMHLVLFACRYFRLDHPFRLQGFLVVEALLKHVGSGFVNERDETGATALHYAAFKGLPEVTCLLLRHGANPLLATHNGRTPRDLAASEDQREVVRLLEVWQIEYELRKLRYLHNTSLLAQDIHLPHWAADRRRRGEALPTVQLRLPAAPQAEVKVPDDIVGYILSFT